MWWENMKIKLIAFGIIIALILLIILTVCGDFHCW
jgi:di/tricarboxylate transporter